MTHDPARQEAAAPPRHRRGTPCLRRSAALLVAAVGLVGCSSGGTGPAAAGSAAATTAGATPAAASATDATPTGSPTADVGAIVLEGDGLGFLTGEASIRHLPFGETDAATIATAVERSLGPGESTPQPDCGPTVVAVRYRDLTVTLEDGAFAGWSEDGAPGGLTTADGLGVGSTLADLRASRTDVTVSEDTVGPEFGVADGLSGSLDGTSDASTVTRIAAGFTCIFR